MASSAIASTAALRWFDLACVIMVAPILGSDLLHHARVQACFHPRGAVTLRAAYSQQINNLGHADNVTGDSAGSLFAYLC